MTLNLYVMPITTVTFKGAPFRSAKYASLYQDTFECDMWDYGDEPWCLVGILDIDAATDSALTANADCLGLPTNLDNSLTTNQRNNVANKLEAANIPGTWVTTSNTWRDVVRFVGALCHFAQVYQGQTGGLWFTGGVTLATQFGALPLAARNGITAAAAFFNFDTSGITGTTTIRAILRSAGQQYLATQPQLQMVGVLI